MFGERRDRDLGQRADRVIGGIDHVQGVARPVQDADLRIADVAADDAEIRLLAAHEVEHLLRDDVLDPEGHGGVLGAEADDRVGQHARREGRQRRDAHDPVAPCREVAGVDHHGVEVAQHALEHGQQVAAEPRRRDGAAGPVEEPRVERLLQAPDLNRQGGLRQVQQGGGPGEAAGLDDRHEGPHLPQVEIHKLRLSLRSDLFNCVTKCSAVS